MSESKNSIGDDGLGQEAELPLFSARVENVERVSHFSPEQEQVIHTWGKGLAVLAGAGSGKTTTLVEKCIQLVQKPFSDRLREPRFIAVSFTERSASDLRAKLSVAFSQREVPGSLNQHWVMTIHGLCGAIIREYPREAGFEGEESILTEAEVQLLWERALETLWMDDLPEPILESLELLLDQESRTSVSSLLLRIRELYSFGVLDFLAKADDRQSLALEAVARYVIIRYERLKKRRAAVDFDDLEKGAERALQDSKVRAAYQQRFQLVLVDEFQDTNPLQASIIQKLAYPDFSNLCVVGDPKQSIYRFRDADVSVFQDFCSRLPVKISLTWNFRSLPGIIHFTNHVCERAFAASQLQFDALVPKREQESLQLGQNAEENVIRLDVKSPEELGAWIRGEVDRGVPLQDMALLVRRIRGNERWLKALSASGIPIAVGSGGLFWEDPRVRELVAFLKWWDFPGNSLSGAIFLRAPWMGIADQDLDRWCRQDPTLRTPFLASDHQIAHELRKFQNKNGVNKVARPGDLLLALLVNQQIEDELAGPLLSLWHKVEDLSSLGLDFHSVVMELSLALEESRREREIPAPKSLGCLLVLTLHGAKGLEFPHVILIDFGDKPRAQNMPLLYWDRTEGVFLGRRDEDGQRDRKSANEQKWRQLEQRKSLEESKRLFYVALTRPRQRLVVVCSELKEPKIFDPNEAYLSDDWRAWLECSGWTLPRSFSVRTHVDNPAGQSQQIHQTADKAKIREGLQPRSRVARVDTARNSVRPRHSVTEWTLLSRCPRAYEWTFIRPVMLPPPPDTMDEISLVSNEKPATNHYVDLQISQQELGTRVHACLENGDYDGLRALEQEAGSVRFMAEPVISWALSSSWMAPAVPERHRFVWTELSFEVPISGGRGRQTEKNILVGSIDRLVKTGEPGHLGHPLWQYTIVDFKVTEKPKSVAALLEAYQTQLELYSQAIHLLDPVDSASEGASIQAVLVNISPASIQTVPVKLLPELSQRKIAGLCLAAVQIVEGQPGNPQPGFLCRYCDFRNVCDESSSKD